MRAPEPGQARRPAPVIRDHPAPARKTLTDKRQPPAPGSGRRLTSVPVTPPAGRRRTQAAELAKKPAPPAPPLPGVPAGPQAAAPPAAAPAQQPAQPQSGKGSGYVTPPVQQAGNRPGYVNPVQGAAAPEPASQPAAPPSQPPPRYYKARYVMDDVVTMDTGGIDVNQAPPDALARLYRNLARLNSGNTPEEIQDPPLGWGRSSLSGNVYGSCRPCGSSAGSRQAPLN